MPYTSDRRLFLLSTPLGEDVLLIRKLEGHEGVSRLFRFQLELLSERDDIAADELIGKRVSLRIETDLDERHFTGIVSHFSQGGRHPDPGADGQELSEYYCEVVPWLWPLTLHEDSRVFQNMSLPDIVEKVLADFQLSDYELDLQDSYPELDYCTQYRETSFAFISRLLERAGIHYYVKYSGETETIVFTDNNDGHPDLDPVEIRFAESRATEEADTISRLSQRMLLRTGRVVMRDHNFETPDDTLETSVDSLIQLGDNQNYQRFVYPGNYMTAGEGETVARVQMEAEEAEHEVLQGESTVRALTPGYCFELDGHPNRAFNARYLVLGVTHSGSNNVSRGAEAGHYENRFTCIPADVRFRERPRTPRPIVHGPQTAVVTGPPGEEIYTDEYGRVKIQFHWDREGAADDKSSCWVRVVMPHAGAGWGMYTVPRVGEEVLVAFEHGDPDRPIVVGSVYNANNMPPYELPAEATKWTLKTNSTGGGGFNELRFEDKGGEEEIFLHAQKDFQERIGNNSSTSIGTTRQLTVGKDNLEAIAENEERDIGKNQMVNIGENAALAVGMSMAQSVGQQLHTTVGTELALDAGTEIHLKGGMNIVLEAGMQISLKAGGSSITIGPAGVTIDGALVRVNCGGSPLSAKKPDKPDKPQKAKEAIKAKAGKVSKPLQRAQATALRNAARQAQPFCAECQAARAALLAMRRGS